MGQKMGLDTQKIKKQRGGAKFAPKPQKNGYGSGGRTVCPERQPFSQFVVLMRTTNCEEDSLLGQTGLPPEQ